MNRDQIRKAERFYALHEGPGTFVLANAWDASSARILEECGFPALGTTSAGIAFARGMPDQGGLGREQMLAQVAIIARTVTCPVSADIEAGYGETPADVAETVRQTIAAGAVGCNIEDGTGDPEAPLMPISRMCERLAAARAAADSAGFPFIINARTDGFWSGGSGPAVLEEAVERGRAYFQVGADCVFVPLVSDREMVRRLTDDLPGPLNLLGVPTLPPLAELAGLGVRRISTGGSLARACLYRLREIGQSLLAEGDFGAAGPAISHAEMNSLMGPKSFGLE